MKENEPMDRQVFLPCEWDDNPQWEAEWQDMPEFIQGKQEPYCCLIVRFQTEKDLNDFSKIIGQKLTRKTKSIWHPFRSHWGNERRVWVDES